MMGCITQSPSPEAQSPNDETTAPGDVVQEVRDLRVSPIPELRTRTGINLPMYTLGSLS